MTPQGVCDIAMDLDERSREIALCPLEPPLPELERLQAWAEELRKELGKARMR